MGYGFHSGKKGFMKNTGEVYHDRNIGVAPFAQEQYFRSVGFPVVSHYGNFSLPLQSPMMKKLKNSVIFRHFSGKFRMVFAIFSCISDRQLC